MRLSLSVKHKVLPSLNAEAVVRGLTFFSVIYQITCVWATKKESCDLLVRISCLNCKGQKSNLSEGYCRPCMFSALLLGKLLIQIPYIAFQHC